MALLIFCDFSDAADSTVSVTDAPASVDGDTAEDDKVDDCRTSLMLLNTRL